jgi:hypothetical protein
LYYDKFKKNFLQEAELRNLSSRTIESYWWHINDYYNFHKKDPVSTGIEELRTYFQSMLTDGGHKPGSIKKWSFGTFVNVVRKANIALANNLLSEEKNDQRMEDIQDGKQTWEKQDTLWNEIMDRIRKHSKFNCPVCKKGTMRFAGMVPPG